MDILAKAPTVEALLVLILTLFETAKTTTTTLFFSKVEKGLASKKKKSNSWACFCLVFWAIRFTKRFLFCCNFSCRFFYVTRRGAEEKKRRKFETAAETDISFFFL